MNLLKESSRIFWFHIAPIFFCGFWQYSWGLTEKISTKTLLLGGRFFQGSVGAIWWFVTCLFAAQVLSSFLLKIKSTKMQIYSTVFLYYIAMLIPWCCSVIMWSLIVVTFRLPLSLDVALMAYHILSDRLCSQAPSCHAEAFCTVFNSLPAGHSFLVELHR